LIGTKVNIDHYVPTVVGQDHVSLLYQDRVVLNLIVDNAIRNSISLHRSWKYITYNVPPYIPFTVTHGMSLPHGCVDMTAMMDTRDVIAPIIQSKINRATV
jgi:hypothetical protein